ncbi:hypothetical protein [Actinokineospora enzanensis]|uniref:hypothetical protein n=1 Tax=Actinokineospora enzanensis TaxID=155975 RepID=UPI000399A047|nr:hypothetical protein [Actinokineospora enzanensis]
MSSPRILRRRWFLAVGTVAAIVVLGVAIALSGAAGQTTPDGPRTGVPLPTTVPTPVATHQIERDWLLVDYLVQDDGTGFFTGRITVTNQAATARMGLFKLEISSGKQLKTLMGQTEKPIDPGETEVVELPIGDQFVAGPYTVVFHEAYA